MAGKSQYLVNLAIGLLFPCRDHISYCVQHLSMAPCISPLYQGFRGATQKYVLTQKPPKPATSVQSSQQHLQRKLRCLRRLQKVAPPWFWSSVRPVKGITCSSINGRISFRFSGLVYKVCTSYNRDKGLHPASHLQLHQGSKGTLVTVRNALMSRNLCLLCLSNVINIVFTIHLSYFIA